MPESLCATCRAFEFITVSDFVVMDQTPPPLWSARYGGHWNIGPLSRVVRESAQCPLCHLVLTALNVDRSAFSSLGGFYRDAGCAVSWTLNDMLAGEAGHRVMVTRALRITCTPSHPSWRTWAKLELHEDSFDDCSDKTFLGRDVPSYVSVPTLRFWVGRCNTTHTACLRLPQLCLEGATARSTAKQSQLSVLRVVDCQKACVVDVPFSTTEYFALSYVWGSGPQLTLSQHNIAELYADGALTRLQRKIPLTIKDAMNLTISLGGRYIWVDSLCIVQDLGRDQLAYVPKMNQIYQHAEMTFSIATGDAMSGILGLQGRPRELRDNKRKFRSHLVLHAPCDIRDSVRESLYATRAWTFQEQYLSRRCLFFLPDQVFFQCRSCTWREDKYLKDEQVATFPMAVADRSPLDMYLSCVENLSRRSLSYLSDILRASAGMMAAISEKGWRSQPNTPTAACGIPLAWFEYGLTWHFEYTIPPVTRRSPNIPSWSWCAWQGPASIMERPQSLEEVNGFMQNTWIRWTLHRIQQTVISGPEIVDITTNQASRSGNLFADTSRYPPVPDQATTPIESDAAHRLCETATYMALHFATLTTTVKVVSLACAQDWRGGYHLGLGDDDDNKFTGFCRIHSATPLAVGTQLRCAAICLTSEAYTPANSAWKTLTGQVGPAVAYHVLVIAKDAAQVRRGEEQIEFNERIGVGFIFKDALDEYCGAVWRDIWLK